MLTIWLKVCFLAFSLVSVGQSQSDYSFLLDGGLFARPGVPVETTVGLSNQGEPVSGWSFGVCLDDSIWSSLSVNRIYPEVPLFEDHQVVIGGITSVAVLPGMGSEILPTTAVLLIEFSFVGNVAAPSPIFSELLICDNLGNPPVPVELMTPSGVAIPSYNSGTVVLSDDPLFRIELGDADVPTSLMEPAEEFTIDVRFSQPVDPFNAEAQGFSFGVANDPALLYPSAVIPVGQLEYLGSGAFAPPPSGSGGSVEFFSVSFFPDGWSIGVIFGGFSTVSFTDQPEPILEISYLALPNSLSPGAEVDTRLEFVETIGIPPVANTVVANGRSRSFDGDMGLISLIPQLPYLRGDTNSDGRVDLADPINLISALFVPGFAAIDCFDSANIDGDSELSIGDAIFAINYLFSSGPQPAAPFPNCGVPPTSQGCKSYDGCGP